MRVRVNGQTLQIPSDGNLLTALVRLGRQPSGVLCLSGDCPNCLATVDGVAYVRMCLTAPREGMEVEPFAVNQLPNLPAKAGNGDVAHRVDRADIVVIGSGESGRSAADEYRASGSTVVTLDERQGLGEALAIYPGPEVIARIGNTIVRIHASEIVVATGAADVLPVVPGSHLRGIFTATAATRLIEAGIDLEDVLALGRPPEGLDCPVIAGTLVRFEGDDRLEAMVTVDSDGEEQRHPCQNAIVDLGTYPRDTLARMGSGSAVRAVGGAASTPHLPPCPPVGTVCPCSEVTIEDLHSVWDRGFRELELIKRATLAGTGTCQGGVCGPYLRSFVAEMGGEAQPSFTARPLARQMTLEEAAAGFHFTPVHRTGLDSVHRRLGAQMDAVGGWWRPWTYGDFESEYWAVRQAVSLGDVGTLGKVLVSGPDAVRFLDHVYPCRVDDLKPGRSRYALVLAESGGLLEDGLVARIDESRFWLTFTSGGASFAEAWLRDWAHSIGAEVRIMDVTHSLGAINVTGPAANELLHRAGLDEPLRFMRHRQATLAGVDCRVFRLSFTGETSYELHHPWQDSERLWMELTRLGTDLDVRPHGLATLQTLRLEKGHVIVGMDTEPDSTPRRLGMEWAVDLDKGDFVGRTALERTNLIPLDRKLVGLTMDGLAPVDGSPVYTADGSLSGYVTSAALSPTLGKSVMLAWVDLIDGKVPPEVMIDGRVAHLARVPFYDPDGTRARA